MDEKGKKHFNPNRRLRAAREQRGWSQTALAEQLGTTELTVGRWERGERSPQVFYRAKLCELFDMTAEELGLVKGMELETSEGEKVFPHAEAMIISSPEPSSQSASVLPSKLQSLVVERLPRERTFWPDFSSPVPYWNWNFAIKNKILLFIIVFILIGTGILAYSTQQSGNTYSDPYSSPEATRAAKALSREVAKNGMMFGFDAAQTRSNSSEKIINTNNVSAVKLLWAYQTFNNTYVSPVVSNGMLYFGSFDRNLYVFDATCRKDCQPLWTYPTDGGIGSPAVFGGMLYFASDKNLYAFDTTCRKGCAPLWMYTAGDSLTAPTVAGGMLYITSSDHKIYAFSATCRKNCQPLWTYYMKYLTYSSPTVGDGMVYIGSSDDNLYAFSATCRSGCQPLWTYPTNGAIISSPTVANGVLYVGSTDHLSVCF